MAQYQPKVRLQNLKDFECYEVVHVLEVISAYYSVRSGVTVHYIVDAIKNGEIAIVINTVGSQAESIADSHSIRSSALKQQVPLYTTIAGSEAISLSIGNLDNNDVYSVQELHRGL